MSSSAIIFGTSNGLFKDGYVAGVADILGTDQTKNCSVGASSSFIWFATRNLAPLNAYDWALLDYCVNDGLMIRAGTNSAENWENSLGTSVAELRAQSCEPVLLILPSLPAMTGPNPLLDIALAFARTYHIPYLNGYALVARLLEARPDLQPQMLFRDPPHLHPEISRLIGQELATALSRLPPPSDWGTATGPSRKYTFKQVDEWLPEERIVERATSLTARKFANITSGTAITVPVADGQRVAGLALDLAKTHGAITVSGDRRWTKAWTNPYHAQWLGVDRAMVFSALPLAGGVGGSNGVVTIAIQDDPAVTVDEAYSNLAPDPAQPLRFALAGVLLEEDAAPSPITLPFDRAPDLLTLCDPALFDKIANAALAKQSVA